MIGIWLRGDLHDGDVLEATISLPAVPRPGEKIEVWVPGASEPRWLNVDAVVWHPYNAELGTGGEVEVSVAYDGYDLDEFRETMEAAGKAMQP